MVDKTTIVAGSASITCLLWTWLQVAAGMRPEALRNDLRGFATREGVNRPRASLLFSASQRVNILLCAVTRLGDLFDK